MKHMKRFIALLLAVLLGLSVLIPLAGCSSSNEKLTKEEKTDKFLSAAFILPPKEWKEANDKFMDAIGDPDIDSQKATEDCEKEMGEYFNKVYGGLVAKDQIKEAGYGGFAGDIWAFYIEMDRINAKAEPTAITVEQNVTENIVNFTVTEKVTLEDGTEEEFEITGYVQFNADELIDFVRAYGDGYDKMNQFLNDNYNIER